MIPSREHFLLNLLNALSIFSFSPTRTVDIYNPPLPVGVYSFFQQSYYIKTAKKSQRIYKHFLKFRQKNSDFSRENTRKKSLCAQKKIKRNLSGNFFFKRGSIPFSALQEYVCADETRFAPRCRPD